MLLLISIGLAIIFRFRIARAFFPATLGLYLGSGAPGSAYGAASSLITLLLWIYYAAQILLFGAEFTQVYANTYGTRVGPQEH